MSTAAIVRCIHYARGSLTNIPYQRQLLILTRRRPTTGAAMRWRGGGVRGGGGGEWWHTGLGERNEAEDKYWEDDSKKIAAADVKYLFD